MIKLHVIVYIGASGTDTEVEMPDDATAVMKNISKRNAMLLNVLGEDAIELASTFCLSDKDLDNYDNLIDAFYNHVAHKINLKYSDQAGNMLQDCVVVRVRDSKLWKGLFRVKNLKLDQAVCNCRAMEPSTVYNKTLEEKDEVNILPEEIFKCIKGNSHMHQTSATFVTYGGDKLALLGIVECMCIVGGAKHPLQFIVLNTTSCPIVGINTCIELRLIQRLHSIKDTTDLRTQSEFVKPKKDVFFNQ
ncbi:hypothetical protein PR048_012802, partial [Dryococelus australis]